jgi:hypothetical protein
MDSVATTFRQAKGSVVVMEKIHVVAAFVSNAEAKISGAWHKRLYNLSER